MTVINEINEENYLEQRQKGEERVTEKINYWKRLSKQDISKTKFKEHTADLWKDPTLWAYSTLRDKQNKPLELYGFQDQIINDKNRFIHVTAANQIGKTWSAGIIKGLHHATFTNNASVMLISRSEDQAKGILDEMKWMLNRAKIKVVSEKNEISNRFEYHLRSPDYIGTSVIRVFPPTPAILSFPATLILMDETGFWEKQTDMDPIEFYQQCVEPRTNATKNWKHPFLTMGQIISITNPNGQNGLAWWLRNNKKYHQYICNWLANPNNSWEDYQIAKSELPPIRFSSVYAAEYVSATGGFIELEQYKRFANYNVPEVIQPGNLYLGGDFASEEPKSKNTDHSTLYGVRHSPNKQYPLNPRIQVVYRKNFEPRTPRENIYNEIERIKKLPGVRIVKFAYDKVGVADSVKRDLIKRGILNEKQIELLTYSLPNKSDVYLNFQALFQQDMIEGREIPILKEQLLALKVEQPIGSPHIKVHHKTEGVKDDEPDALANACYVARNFTSFANVKFISKLPEPSKKPNANEKFMDWLDRNKAQSFY